MTEERSPLEMNVHVFLRGVVLVTVTVFVVVNEVCNVVMGQVWDEAVAVVCKVVLCKE